MVQKRRSANRRQGQQGGAGAAEFVGNVVGNTVDQQMANSLQNGDNTIKPLMHGGRPKKRSNRKKSQKGGYWSQVISTAVVPLSLFALNQHFAKRSKRNSRKNVSNDANTRKRR
jgi:hypothetical protein